MSVLEIIIIGLSLSADAFISSVCKGLTLEKNNIKESLIIGIYFGIFQAIMPLIGYVLADNFHNLIINIDHWISFFLLLILGIKTILESNKKEQISNNKLDFKNMIILSIATSTDALAIGISFAFLDISIIKSCIIIGFITFTTSTLGAKIGNKVGNKYQKISQVFGGIILIIMGIKILIEHLN